MALSPTPAGQRVPPRHPLVLQLNVVISLVVATVALGERLTMLQAVGCAVTLGGVIAVIRLQAPPRAFLG